MKRFLPAIVTPVLLAAALSLSGCGDSSPKTLTMVLTQPAPVHHLEYFGHPAGTIGDLHTFEAELSENGTPVGELDGERVLTETSVDVAWAVDERLPDVDGVDPTKVSIWRQTMTFHLKGRGEIQVQGDRLLVDDTSASATPFMVAAAEQPLAIVGGTGEFMFTRGEVVSIRNEDGTYTHTLTYRLS